MKLGLPAVNLEALPVVETAAPPLGYNPSEPVSASNPLPVASDDSDFVVGEPVSASNPLPVASNGSDFVVGEPVSKSNRRRVTIVSPGGYAATLGTPFSSSNPLPVTTTSTKGGGFNLASYLASLSDGVFYDFLQTDRLFQENVGPTPANDPGEVIGLALSSRQWAGQTLAQYLAAQPELVANGDFATGDLTGWTQALGTSAVVGGAARVQANGTSEGRIFEIISTVPGRTYRLSGRVAGGTVAGEARVTTSTSISSPLLTLSSAAGSFEGYFTATTSTTYIILRINTTTNGLYADFDDISVKEVSRYAATQATGSFKPKYQTTGGQGDGLDDRLATGFAISSGDGFLVVPEAQVAASLSGTQVLAGAMDGSSNGWYLAITTGGALRGRVGQTTLDSTGLDLRNGTHDLAMWTDGSTLYLWANGFVVASGAWTGTRPTTTWNLFALNNNGAASNFAAVTAKAFVAGLGAINASRAAQIAASF